MEKIEDYMEFHEKEEFEKNQIRASLGEYVPNKTTDEDIAIYIEVESQIFLEDMADSDAASSENSSFYYDVYDEHLASLRHTAIRYTEEERQVDEAYERY